jgi:cytochrome c553
MVQESTRRRPPTAKKSTSAVPGKETVMKFTAPRSSPLFAIISVVVLSFTFVSAQAQTASNDGAALYKTKCAMCHGPDGAGKTPVGTKLNVRDLRSPEVQKQSDSDLA